MDFPCSSCCVRDAPRESPLALFARERLGRFYVVDRIFDVAELRLGLKEQQVVRIQRVASPKRRRGA
jgi:type IV secretion system protein VirB9